MKKQLLMLLMTISIVSSGQTLQKVRVSPQWTPQCQFAGIYMAYAKGFYKEAGLDVEIIHPSAAISSVAMLKQGQTDIITSQLIEAMIYKDTGVDLINVLQVSEHNSLIILSREPLKSVYDLNNKKIGRWAVGFGELAMAFVNGYGLDVQWIPFLSNIALYVSGAIDATLCMGYNEFFQIKMSVPEILENQIFRFEKLGYDVPEDGLYVLKDYYKNNKEVVNKFTEATKRGWEWVRNPDNHEETLDYVMTLVEEMHVTTNRVNQKYMLEEILRLQEGEGGKAPYRLTKEIFDFTNKLMLDNNFILNSIAYEDFIN